MAASTQRSVISLIQKTLYILYFLLFAHLLDQVNTNSLPRQFQCSSEYSSYTYDQCQAKFLDAACWQGLEGSGIIGDCPSICNHILSDSDEGRCRDDCPDYYKTCMWVVITPTSPPGPDSPGHGNATPQSWLYDAAIAGPVFGGIVGLVVIVILAMLYCYLKKKLCYKLPTIDGVQLNKKGVKDGSSGFKKGGKKKQMSRTSSTRTLVTSQEVSQDDSCPPAPTDSDNRTSDEEHTEIISTNETPDHGQICTDTNEPDGTLPNDGNIDRFPPVSDAQVPVPNRRPLSPTHTESGYISASGSNTSLTSPLANRSLSMGSLVNIEGATGSNDTPPSARPRAFSFDGLGTPKNTLWIEAHAEHIQLEDGETIWQYKGVKVNTHSNSGDTSPPTL